MNQNKSFVMSNELELISDDQLPKTNTNINTPLLPQTIHQKQTRNRTRRNPCVNVLEGHITNKSREIVYLIIYTLLEIGYMLTTNKFNPFPYGLMCVTIVGNSLLVMFVLSRKQDESQIQKYQFLCIFGFINCINISQMFFMFGPNKTSPIVVTQSSFGALCINFIWLISAISILVVNCLSVFCIFFGLIMIFLL